jgi:F0F1-type ATP synthase membrane subunit b/b'
LDLSVLWVIFFILVLTPIVNALLFKPLQWVMHEREGAVSSSRALAEESARRAAAASSELEAKTAAARAEVYKAMDERRQVALAYRAELMVDAKQKAAATLSEATLELEKAHRDARATLESDARVLGDAIVARVLDRQTA